MTLFDISLLNNIFLAWATKNGIIPMPLPFICPKAIHTWDAPDRLSQTICRKRLPLPSTSFERLSLLFQFLLLCTCNRDIIVRVANNYYNHLTPYGYFKHSQASLTVLPLLFHQLLHFHTFELNFSLSFMCKNVFVWPFRY